MVDNDKLRRARRVRGFLGRVLVQRMNWLARPPDMYPIELCGIVCREKSQYATQQSLERELVNDRGMLRLADIRKSGQIAWQLYSPMIEINLSNIKLTSTAMML